MTMMYVMHHAFRRDLAAFAAAAGATPVTDRRAWKALAERWELFSSALHHHHSGEDAGLWPALVERADEEGRATLEAMEAEHAEIDPILEACAAGLAAARRARRRRRPGGARRAARRRAGAARPSTAARGDRGDRADPGAAHRRGVGGDHKEHFDAGVAFREILTLVPWVAHGLPDAGAAASCSRSPAAPCTR